MLRRSFRSAVRSIVSRALPFLGGLGIVAGSLSFVSGVGASAAGKRALHPTLSATAEATSVERPHVHRVEHFQLIAANNNETMIVELVDGVPTERSKTEAKHLMRCLKNDVEHDIDPRLITMMWRIAHEAAGTLSPASDVPTLLLISGFRTPENRADKNFHTQGKAADVRIPGTYSWRMRDLARKLGVPGLGTYPTTNMIHVDVRDDPYSWVDYSGPRH